MSEKYPFRILSLDGGGMRGALSAKILEQVEQQILEKENKSLTEYFDLVAGTSTGSILAAGIALGLKASELFKLYDENGNQIFSSIKRKLRKLIPGGGGYLIPFTRYSNQGLKELLQEKLVFSNDLIDRKTDQLPSLLDVEKSPKSPTLLILAYNTTGGYTQYFASNAAYKEGGEPEWFTYKSVSDFCLCSSAAPTFFPPYKLIDSCGREQNYIDGGVAANNPDLAAITHAMYTKTRVNSQEDNSNPALPALDLSDISVFSIGTGKVDFSFDYKTVDSWGLVDWANKISDIFLAAPAQFEEAVTRQLILGLTTHQRYRRVNLNIEALPIDDPGIIKKLVETYKKQKDCIKSLDFTDMTNKEWKLEDLVNDFIEKNKRDADQHFKNRFD
ncbi:patatin-like phospholipase family protein [Okeania sp.]|uniref:patatin-like phospholipase family protein n=1 Tax=Okeania sp. TaxID=3100323 RepID=UPI002B4ABC32|nr:patatin-like phospholipase family protein [Okeania sp.]MEB3340817.1 patatin-like phospholipase family protein [Okeania sp.]